MESDDMWEAYSDIYEGRIRMFVDTVSPRMVYRYRVRAYAPACGWSDWSAELILSSKGELFSRLNVRGSGVNNPMPAYVQLDGEYLVYSEFRGLHLTVLHRGDLSAQFNQTFDTFGSSSESEAMSEALEQFNATHLVIVVSCDAWEEQFNRRLAFALAALGGFQIQRFGSQMPPLETYDMTLTTNHGHPYALIAVPTFARVSGQSLEALRNNTYSPDYDHQVHNSIPPAQLSTQLYFVSARQFYYLNSAYPFKPS